MTNKEILTNNCRACGSPIAKGKQSVNRWLSRLYCSGHCRQVVLSPGRRAKKRIGTSYSSLHRWVARRLVKPLSCEHCGQTKPLDLANKSGDYSDELDDWLWLCKSCHKKYDMRTDYCRNGHEYTPLIEVIRSDGTRTCRECSRTALRRYRAKQPASA